MRDGDGVTKRRRKRVQDLTGTGSLSSQLDPGFFFTYYSKKGRQYG